MEQPTPRRSRIPTFASIEEAAEFWDTHDSSDFEDEWEPVDIEIAPDLRSVRFVEVELDDATADRLFALARERGIRASALVRSWIDEALGRASPGDAGAVAPAATTRDG